MEQVSAAKARARARARERRRGFVASQGPGGRAEQADRLAAAFLTWLRGYAVQLGQPDLSRLTVTAYAPLPTEPPVSGLVHAARAAGIRVLLPVTVASSHTLRWVPATERTGEGSREQIMQGTVLEGDELGPEALLEVDVALVPGLAVDSAGHRLGQGGGYYDRALPLVRPGVPVIVVLHDHEAPGTEGPGTERPGAGLPVAAAPPGARDDDVPHARHDIPVDAVLTTAGVTWLRDPDPTA